MCSRDFEITFFGEAREDAGRVLVGRIRNKFHPELFNPAGPEGVPGTAGVEYQVDPFAIYFSVEPDSLVGVTEQWAKRTGNEDKQHQCVPEGHRMFCSRQLILAIAPLRRPSVRSLPMISIK